jgi:hypothetical protein
MGWCRVKRFGLISVVEVGFYFYQISMMVLWRYRVFSVDSCFINKQMEIKNARI